MRFYLLCSGLAIIAIGIVAMNVLERAHALGFLHGSLTLGGGFVICALFSFRMKWQGIIGAGIIALLGAGRGLFNFSDLARFLVGERERGAAPLLELGVTVICVIVLINVLRALAQERVRRMLAEESESPPAR